MFEELQKKDFFSNFAQKMTNKKLKEAIKDYSLHYFSPGKEINLNQYPDILQNAEISSVIVIDHYPKSETDPEKKENIIRLIHQLYTKNNKLELFFLYSTKKIFDDNIQIKYKELENTNFFDEELFNFNECFRILPTEKKIFSKINNIISPILSAYLIKESYYKLNSNRITDFYSNINNSTYEKTIDEDDYIELRLVGSGISVIFLIYHIKDEKLYALKKLNSIDGEKLKKREINNYTSKINHPFINNFYGITKENHHIVIEYINGKTLKNTDISKYSEIDIFSIIIQILSVFEYLHENHFIYRDLKPYNIMIDSNKTAVLIDFDRMLNESEIKNIKEENDYTKDFATEYVAPEVNLGIYTNKCDIYSIGKIINFLTNNDFFNSSEFSEIKQLINQSYEKEPDKRPIVSEITYRFYSILVIKNIILSNIDRNSQFKLGKTYNKMNKINEAIQCYVLSANQKHSDAQNNLGNIYYEGKYITQNINKAIHYYTLAANQNHSDAQNSLSVIYYEGKYIPRDINRSIYYISLAVNQNNSKAQNSLGIIYYEGKYITQNINKAIHYFSMAANQNYSYAQLNLGYIYYEGKYIAQNINKAIHYFSLAASQNNSDAQLNLGYIYYEGEYIAQNINKAIHYFSLAASQNNSDAQFRLGSIYYNLFKTQKIKINLGIYWILESSKNGNIDAFFFLGFLYQEGKHIDKDIKKSIHNYKEASSFNNQYAKNNLGIIYKHGIENEVEKNTEMAKIYFQESIKQKNDAVSMYNLAHLYLYEEQTEESIDKSINLFINSLNLEFLESVVLLLIALFKKYDRNIEIVKNDLIRRNKKAYNYLFIEEISELNQFLPLFSDEKCLKDIYQKCRSIDFLYNQSFEVIVSNHLYDFKKNQKPQIIKQGKALTRDFYNGFGCNN